MIHEIPKHPALQYAQDISYLCEPLKKLNISYFSHVKIDNKKQFSVISSNPLFLEHYLKNKYYTADIHMVDKRKFGNFFVWDGMKFNAQSAKICVEASGFKVNNPFTIIQRNNDSIDYYHFANDSKSKQINQVYLANIDLLNLFISYFNERINQSKLLARAYDLKFDLGLNKEKQLAFEDPAIVLSRDEFFQSLNFEPMFKKLRIGHTVLSKRQSEILQYIVRGKTLKQISQILRLSERTVANYFETLKIKLNVASKSELISKTIDIESIKIK